MKKLFLFLMLLIVGVLTTACVNTYAVKQLNDIAIEYLQKGDTKAAISRLEASVDLDGNIYESRYNLAVAYMRINECEKALKNIKAAQLLTKKEEPSVYYTIGVADTCIAKELFKENYEENNEENFENDKKENDMQQDNSSSLDVSTKAKQYVNYLTDANENFDKYIKLQPNADDATKVKETVEQNKIEIEEKKKMYGE